MGPFTRAPRKPHPRRSSLYRSPHRTNPRHTRPPRNAHFGSNSSHEIARISGSQTVVVMKTTEGPVWMDGLTHKAPDLHKHQRNSRFVQLGGNRSDALIRMGRIIESTEFHQSSTKMSLLHNHKVVQSLAFQRPNQTLTDRIAIRRSKRRGDSSNPFQSQPSCAHRNCWPRPY